MNESNSITKSTHPCVLSINGGSSSIKFALFECGNLLRRKLAGGIDRIGLPDGSLQVKGTSPTDNFSWPAAVPDHSAAVSALMDWLSERTELDSLTAVGHRIVHGGPKFHQPQRITSDMTKELQLFSPFDPEHLPVELMLIEAFQKQFPDLPQIACFDAAFHHDLLRVARLLPIPRRYEAQGVRRYRFHGLSYEVLMQESKRPGDPTAKTGRVILAHLGNGANLAAVRDGKCLDTSMSFTPTSGLPMGTRSGENAPVIRSRICDSKDFLGLKMDQTGNSVNTEIICNNVGGATVRVIHSDKTQMIARSVCRVLDMSVDENNSAYSREVKC